ncbi:AraC family transcriptional regulator [Grimontia kaedaensis]|uniref:AraC family transcriptional regulator n=1 Tax=Grimontia kaedaensis TaxID=2872157 RepID=A0ABY4WVI2_9GAMM|nr:AraC family transcriptional regulator ligand-binding domain-containing protein [Grimontia kaedaensis]USH03177.1 AraC family transcriptional regulator [Grimontia kaedaensis]
MDTSPTLVMGFLLGLDRILSDLGWDTEAIKTQLKLPKDLKSSPDERCGLNIYNAFWKLALDQRNDPLLGFRVGIDPDFKGASALGQAVKHSPTLRHSLLQLSEMSPLLNQAQRIVLVEENDFACLRILNESDEWEMEMHTDRMLAGFVAFSRQNLPLGSSQTAFIELERSLSEQEQTVASDLLGCEVLGSKAFNQLVFNSQFLNMPLSDSNEYIHGVLSEHARQLMQEIAASGSFANEVKKRIVDSLHHQKASADDIAESLGVSAQSLYRKLKAEGETFQDILDSTRHDLAVAYLKQGKLSIKEISYWLAFSEPRAFHRAFRRWEGCTPKEYTQ